MGQSTSPRLPFPPRTRDAPAGTRTKYLPSPAGAGRMRTTPKVPEWRPTPCRVMDRLRVCWYSPGEGTSLAFFVARFFALAVDVEEARHALRNAIATAIVSLSFPFEDVSLDVYFEDVSLDVYFEDVYFEDVHEGKVSFFSTDSIPFTSDPKHMPSGTPKRRRWGWTCSRTAWRRHGGGGGLGSRKLEPWKEEGHPPMPTVVPWHRKWPGPPCLSRRWNVQRTLHRNGPV
eukprot:scaffold86_cov338-Pavlova_lutheri.AAC.59